MGHPATLVWQQGVGVVQGLQGQGGSLRPAQADQGGAGDAPALSVQVVDDGRQARVVVAQGRGHPAAQAIGVQPQCALQPAQGAVRLGGEQAIELGDALVQREVGQAGVGGIVEHTLQHRVAVQPGGHVAVAAEPCAQQGQQGAGAPQVRHAGVAQRGRS